VNFPVTLQCPPGFDITRQTPPRFAIGVLGGGGMQYPWPWLPLITALTRCLNNDRALHMRSLQ